MNQDIKEQIEHNGLVINRIASWAKSYIKDRAKEEFCNDYGQLISALIKDSEELIQLKKMFFNNELDIKLGVKKDEENEDKERKSISGAPIKSFKKEVRT